MYTITIQNKKANLFGQIQYTKTESYVKPFFDKRRNPAFYTKISAIQKY